MPAEAWLEWTLRGVMALASIFVFLIGRDQKRVEEILALKLRAVTDDAHVQRMELERRVKHELREELQALIWDHHAQMAARFDKAGQKSSDEANRVMVKINDLDGRLIRVETRLETT